MMLQPPFSLSAGCHSFYTRPPGIGGEGRLAWRGRRCWDAGRPGVRASQAGPTGSQGSPDSELEEEERQYEAASLSTTGFPFPTSYLTRGSVYNYWRRAARGCAAPDSTQQAAELRVDPPAAAAPAGEGGPASPSNLDSYPQLLVSRVLSPTGSLSSMDSLELVPAEVAGEGGGAAAGATGPVRPVFRAAPYSAELARQRQGVRDTVRILFLDEGNSCRSVLAVAVMRYMLGRLRTRLDVQVESASIGWATPGSHDPRVVRIAQEMALPLQPRTAREFDELEDIVQYDLVLVMDSFDWEEVMREVAVLERINPQGLYSTRVRRLGGFGAASLRAIPGQLADDLPDPLYGSMSAAAELSSLRAAVHRIAFACRGLVHCLAQLRARAGPTMSLRRALAVSLQCPLLCPSVMQGRERLAERGRPVWQEKGQLYTIRWSGQQQRVVRRCTNGKPRGYWRDPANVEFELREWMATQPGASADRLPTQQLLRDSGANTLAAAIQALGGLAEFSRRLGLPLAARHPNGYWEDFANLEKELEPFLRPLMAGAGAATGQGAATAAATGGALRQRPGARRLAAATAPQPALVFPKQQQLVAAGRLDLVYAIRQHGGSAAVARRMGAGLVHNNLSSPEAVCEELLRFVGQRQAARPGGRRRGGPAPTPSLDVGGEVGMPTRPELYMAGRSDLAQAIKRFGGFHYFAGLTGLGQVGEAASKAAAAAAAAAAAGAAGSGDGASGALQRQTQRSLLTALAGAPVRRRPSGGGARDSRRSPVKHASSSGDGMGGRVGESLLWTQDGSSEDDTWALTVPSPWPETCGAAAGAGTSREGAARAVASRPWRSIRSAPLPGPDMQQPGLGALMAGFRGSGATSSLGSGSPSAIPWALPAAAQPVRAVGGGSGGGTGPGLPPSPTQLAVGTAVLEFMESAGMDTLPSRQVLLQAGRRDLANAVQRCGGGRRLAEHLGLEFEERRGRKPKHALEVASRPPPRGPESALDDGFVLV